MNKDSSPNDPLVMVDIYGVTFYGEELIKCVLQTNTSHYDRLDQDKKEKLTSFASSKVNELAQYIRQLTAEQEQGSEREKYIERVLDLLNIVGFRVFHVEVEPNQYSNDPSYYHKPWIHIHTEVGALLVGARKRVTVLDWSQSWITSSAEDLFSGEKVTKGEKMIHAWDSTSKLEEYLCCLYTKGVVSFIEDTTRR